MGVAPSIRPWLAIFFSSGSVAGHVAIDCSVGPRPRRKNRSSLVDTIPVMGSSGLENVSIHRLAFINKDHGSCSATAKLVDVNTIGAKIELCAFKNEGPYASQVGAVPSI